MPFLNWVFAILVTGLPACASVQTPAPSASVSNITPIHAAPGQLTHTVQKGETLWHIAKVYRIDLEDLARLNRISESGSISSGQIIVLPLEAHAQPNATNFANIPSTEFIWPAKGKILNYFQQRNDGVGNKGIDINTQNNQAVVAARSGKVAFVGNLAGYGNTIIIDHADGFSSVYCGPAEVSVKLNDNVKQGDVIAKAGAFPRASGDTLHFEIRKQHKPLNPLFFLD